MEKIKFGDWLAGQLAARNMKPADLSRASELDSAVISNLINNKRNAGVDTCKAIARGLKVPIAEVLIAAGIMEPDPQADPITNEAAHLMTELDTTQKRDVLEYVKLRHRIAQQAIDHAGNTKRVSRGHAPT